MSIFAPITLSILGVSFLSRCSKDRLTKSIALSLCLALVGMAVYVIPAEPLKPGFLGREFSSPLWYRLGRLGLVLSLCFLLLRRNSRKSQPD
jgi:amino acid permease